MMRISRKDLPSITRALALLACAIFMSACGSNNPEDGDPAPKKVYCFQSKGDNVIIAGQPAKTITVTNIVQKGCDPAPDWRPTWNAEALDVKFTRSGTVGSLLVSAGGDPTTLATFSEYGAIETIFIDVTDPGDHTISGNRIMVQIKRATPLPPPNKWRIFRVFPKALEFGFLKIGLSRTLPVLVSNPTQDKIVFGNIRVGGSTAFTIDVGGFELEPSQSGVILVTFTPATEARSGASLILIGGEAARSVALLGSGVK